MYMETTVKEAGNQQRIVQLPNGMRVRCVSNPEAKQSTVAVRVDIGSTADPREWPGMAHLVGHLVVASNDGCTKEKVNCGNGTSKSIGGDKREDADGATAAAVEVLPFMTTIWLTVSHAAFGKTLRTIGQCLAEPWFGALDSRTIDSIQAEFERACSNDNRRLQRLVHALGDKDHPLTRANAGNRDTLQGLLQGADMQSGDGRKVARQFFEKYYSADIMRAAVVGCGTLDRIAEEVAEAFGSIKSRGDTRIRVSSSPYPAARMGRVVRFHTLGNPYVLELVFPVTEICSGARNVDGCVAAIVETGVAGALAASLRGLGLANNVSGWSEWLGSAAEFGGFFHIKVACTGQGFEKYAETAEMVLAYLAAIREAVAAARAAADPAEPAESVVMVAQRMADLCAANQALAAVLQTHTSLDVAELARFLNRLHPTNCRVMLGAPIGKDSFAEKEPYYGIRYAEDKLPDSVLRTADSKYSSRNRAWRGLFVPPLSDRSSRAWLLELTESCEIWAADTKGDAASATVHILLENSVSAQSPRAAECTHLLAALVHEKTLQEMAGVWRTGSANFSVSAAATGVVIRVSQPTDAINGTAEEPTLRTLLMWILQNARAVPARHTAERFVRQKAVRREQLGSAHAHRLNCPGDAAAWHARRLTRQDSWLHETSLRELDALDHAWFVRTAEQMLAAATRIVVLAAAASPLVRAQTVQITRGLLGTSGAATFQPPLAPALHRPAAPAYDLDPGTYQLHVDHASESTGSAASEYSAVSYTMLAGGGAGAGGGRRGCALTLVLAHVMRGAFIGGMRAGRAHGASAVRLCAQGSDTPWLLRLRIEAFLRAFRRDVLGAMSDAAFAAAVDKCLVPTEASTRELVWTHIVDGDYDFDRAAAIRTHLRALRIRDVVAFWDACIEPRSVLSSSSAAGVLQGSSERRAIVVHVWGAAQKMPGRQLTAGVQRYPMAVLAVHSCLLALQSAGELARAVDLEELNGFVESCAEKNAQTPSGGNVPLRTAPVDELCALAGYAGSGSKSGNPDAVAQLRYALDMAIEAVSATPPASHIPSASRRLDNVCRSCAWRTAADEWVVENVQWFRTMHPTRGQPVPFSRLTPSI